LYVAVIVSVPVASDVVVSIATPALSAAVPKVFVPNLNVTDPVGVPVVEDVTVAVKVTDWPVIDGFGDAVSVMLVAAFVTTWDIAVDVLAALFASPL